MHGYVCRHVWPDCMCKSKCFPSNFSILLRKRKETTYTSRTTIRALDWTKQQARGIELFVRRCTYGASRMHMLRFLVVDFFFFQVLKKCTRRHGNGAWMQLSLYACWGGQDHHKNVEGGEKNRWMGGCERACPRKRQIVARHRKNRKHGICFWNWFYVAHVKLLACFRDVHRPSIIVYAWCETADCRMNQHVGNHFQNPRQLKWPSFPHVLSPLQSVGIGCFQPSFLWSHT